MRKFVAAASLAIASIGAAALPALAHAALLSSSPVAHSQASGNPPYVDLRFSSRVIGAEQVQVHDATGHDVAVGQVQVLDGGTRMRARIPTLGAGDYIVDWRALSNDGHLSLGRYGFSVGVAGRQVGSSSGPVPTLEAAVRWVYLMALLVGFGSLVTRVFTWSSIRMNSGHALPSIPLAPVLTLATFGAMAQAALVLRRSGFDAGQLPVMVGLLQAALVLGSLWLVTRQAPDRVVLGALGVTVVVAALGGHSVTSAHWWGGPANAVHLLAVALWTGGLAQLAVVGWRLRSRDDLPALLQGARRYARFALVSVMLAILTGVLSAMAEFSSVRQLTDSGYGRILLVKVGLVGFTLALALGARLLAIPNHRPERPRLLRRLVRGESAVLVSVVAAAALLANTAPPQPAIAAPDRVAVPTLTGPVVDLVDYDSRFLVRLRVSSDTILVQLRDVQGRPPRGAQVDVFTVTPDYDDLNVYPRSCGEGCAAGDYPLQPGSTALLVVSHFAGRETTVAFAVHWPPSSASGNELTALRSRVTGTPALNLHSQHTDAGGTRSSPPVTSTGADALRSLGLDEPTLVALPFQPRADEVLGRTASGDYYELSLDTAGTLTHEVVTNSRGRTEWFVQTGGTQSAGIG
ncbi:MAG: copper resistance CopC/CopD family protein [Candidatus Dormibacteria bacterium]